MAQEAKAKKKHHWWDRPLSIVRSVANTVSALAPAMTLLAIATAGIPGLDAITALLATIFDAVALANSIFHTFVDIKAHNWSAAALDGLSAVGSLAGIGYGAAVLRPAAQGIGEAGGTLSTARAAYAEAKGSGVFKSQVKTEMDAWSSRAKGAAQDLRMAQLKHSSALGSKDALAFTGSIGSMIDNVWGPTWSGAWAPDPALQGLYPLIMMA